MYSARVQMESSLTSPGDLNMFMPGAIEDPFERRERNSSNDDNSTTEFATWYSISETLETDILQTIEEVLKSCIDQTNNKKW